MRLVMECGSSLQIRPDFLGVVPEVSLELFVEDSVPFVDVSHLLLVVEHSPSGELLSVDFHLFEVLFQTLKLLLTEIDILLKKELKSIFIQKS